MTAARALVSAEALLQLLQAVTTAVNSSLVIEDILESLGDVVREAIPHSQTILAILDDTQNSLQVLLRLNPEGELVVGEHSQWTRGRFVGDDPLLHWVHEQVIRQQAQPAIISQTSQIPSKLIGESFLCADDNAPLTNLNSILVVPLLNKGLLVGVLLLGHAQHDGFTSAHQQAMTTVMQPIAMAVENAKLYWQTQAQASREFLINQLTSTIRRSLDGSTMLKTAADEVGRAMGTSRCLIQYAPNPAAFLLPDALDYVERYQYVAYGVEPLPVYEWAAWSLETGIYQARGLFDTPSEANPSGEKPSNSLLTAWATDTRSNPFVLNDAQDAPPVADVPLYTQTYGVSSLLMVPIVVANQFVGAITLHQTAVPRVWLTEDIQLLQAIAAQLAVGLHQAQLFQAVEQQRRTLETTLYELQQAQIQLIQSEKMAVLGQFVAGIAHEVNTPLGAIRSNTETMTKCVTKWIEGAGKPDSIAPFADTVTQLLEINLMATHRIDEIVRNLRNFARLDESELKIVSLKECVDSTLLLLRQPLQEARIQVEQRLDPALPSMECFPGLLNQVIMNLLVNAIHALEGRPTRRITVQAGALPQPEGAPWIQLRIADTGCGIKPEHLAQIFDPGFTTKGVGVGTGLGLALCFKILEKHRGKIAVDSTPGQGTTFTLTWPSRLSG